MQNLLIRMTKSKLDLNEFRRQPLNASNFSDKGAQGLQIIAQKSLKFAQHDDVIK